MITKHFTNYLKYVIREIAKQLRKLSRYDGGKKLVRELVAEWKEKYPKRKAMMEEIDKVIVTNPKERG